MPYLIPVFLTLSTEREEAGSTLSMFQGCVMHNGRALWVIMRASYLLPFSSHPVQKEKKHAAQCPCFKAASCITGCWQGIMGNYQSTVPDASFPHTQYRRRRSRQHTVRALMRHRVSRDADSEDTTLHPASGPGLSAILKYYTSC